MRISGQRQEELRKPLGQKLRENSIKCHQQKESSEMAKIVFGQLEICRIAIRVKYHLNDSVDEARVRGMHLKKWSQRPSCSWMHDIHVTPGHLTSLPETSWIIVDTDWRKMQRYWRSARWRRLDTFHSHSMSRQFVCWASRMKRKSSITTTATMLTRIKVVVDCTLELSWKGVYSSCTRTDSIAFHWNDRHETKMRRRKIHSPPLKKWKCLSSANSHIPHALGHRRYCWLTHSFHLIWLCSWSGIYSVYFLSVNQRPMLAAAAVGSDANQWWMESN